MQHGQRFSPKPQAALLLAALLVAAAGSLNFPAAAQDEAIEPPGEIENPADVAPDGAEPAPEEESIAPEEFPPAGNQQQPKVLDRSFMRPDLKGGSEGETPPQSAEESKQDKLVPLPDDLPLPTPVEKPKMLSELYEQLA